MIHQMDFRWVWHDLAKGAPPNGSIRVSDNLYQKLQFREWEETGWSDWMDVPHSGVVA